MADVPERGFRKYWRQELSSLKPESHAITNKYPKAVSVVKQVHKLISGTEILANTHRLEWGNALSGQLL
jgi:hypothetical protein